MIEAEWWDYDSVDELADAVAGDVGFIVESALEARDAALIALPGGPTAAAIYPKLAERKLAWKRVTIIPTDDRLAPMDSELSNIRGIAKAFLPVGARVIPIATGIEDYRLAGNSADARLQDFPWPPDLVWLGMGKDGHTASIFAGPDQLHDGGLDWAKVVALKETEEVRDVEILARAGYSLGVRVSDESGLPLQGATVLVMPRFRPLGDSYPEVDWVREPKSVPREGPLARLAARFLHVTDAEGASSFDGLPEPVPDQNDRWPSSTVDVFAFKKGFDPARVRLEKRTPGKRVEVVLRVHRPFVVTGVVRRADASPVAGAEVALESAYLPVASARTNEAGEYRMTADVAPNANASLSAEAPGFSRLVQTCALEPGKDSRHDFTLLPSMSITGCVVDDAGIPVAGMVQASSATSPIRSLSGRGGTVRHAAIIQPDGTFEFEGADSSEWTVRAILGKEWVVPRGRIVRGGDRVEIVVSRAVVGVATLDAEIVDVTTGKPVDSLSATLSSRSGFGDGSHPPRATVSSGRVRAEQIPVGQWRLSLQTSAFGRIGQDFTVAAADRDVRLRFELGKPAVILARVVLDDLLTSSRPSRLTLFIPHSDELNTIWMDEAGKPLPPSSSGIASAANGWTGRCELTFPSGPVRLTVAGGAAFDEKVVTLAPGEERTVELRPVVPGFAKIELSKPVRAGIVFKARGSDGELTELFRLPETKEKWFHDVRRRPGPFLWRVELWPLEGPSATRVPKIVEGETLIEAGERARLVIPVPD